MRVKFIVDQRADVEESYEIDTAHLAKTLNRPIEDVTPAELYDYVMENGYEAQSIEIVDSELVAVHSVEMG